MKATAYLAALALFGFVSASAAQTTGSIEGKVTAPDGSAVTGASIRAESGAPGVRGAVTGSGGQYHLSALPPGTYQISVSASGYSPARVRVVVSLGATTRADIALLPAQAETVTVEAAPLIDPRATELGHTLDASAFTKVPLSRTYTSVALLLPGVTADNAGFSVMGSTGLENAFYLDGVNATGVEKGAPVKTLPEEFLSEVEVTTGNFSAEYGEVFGGIINAVTRSGGNAFHGQAFGYYDNQSLQAKAKPGVVGGNFAGFANEDFGAGLGGYILKDSLWFYGVYDRQDLSRDTRLVTGSGSPYDGTTFRSQDRGQNLYAAKLTWSPASSASIVASVVGDPYSDSQQLIEDGPPQTRSIHEKGGRPDYSVLATGFGTKWTAEVGVFRHQELLDRTPDFTPPFLTTDASQVPTWDLANCALPGCYSGAPWVFESALFDPLLRQTFTRQEERATFTLFSGNHEFKGGLDYEDLSGNVKQSIPGGYARILSSYQGIPIYTQIWFGDASGQFGAAHAVQTVSGSPKTQNVSAFVQDSWTIVPSLVANLGVRYSQYTLDDAVTGDTIAKLKNNFAPRIGLAWDPEDNHRSTVTASYGRFYEAIPLNHQASAFRGSSLAVTTLSGYSFDCSSAAVNCQSEPNRFAEPADPGLRAPAMDEFSLAYHRALTPTFSVGIEAMYARLARAVEDRCDLKGNDAALAFTGNGCVLMNPGMGAYGQGQFSAVVMPDGSVQPVLCTNGLNSQEGRAAIPCPAVPAARRLYRGVALTAEKRFSTRAYLLASYLYSSLRGNYDGTFNELGQSDPNTNFDYDYPGLENNAYGRLANDRPHQAKLAGFYAFPFGLTAGVSAYYRSGSPEDKLGSFNNVQGAPIPMYLAPRGSVGRTPADYDCDLHLDYSLGAGPVRVDAIVDVFRVFNRQTVLRVNPFYNFDGFQADNGTQTNPDYGQPIERGDPRLLRLGMRVTF